MFSMKFNMINKKIFLLTKYTNIFTYLYISVLLLVRRNDKVLAKHWAQKKNLT